MNIPGCLARIGGAGLVLVTLVGCTAGELDEGDEQAESASSAASESSALDANAILSRLGGKVKRCEPLTDAERRELFELRAAFQQPTLEVMATIKCTMGPKGSVASATVSLARQGGYSTKDGVFGEVSLATTVKVSVPIRFVTASGSVAYSETYRTTSDVAFSRSASVSAGADVKLDAVIGSVTGGVSVSNTGKSTVSLSVESASVPVPTSVCGIQGGKASVGASVKISNPTKSNIIIGDVNRLLRIDGVNRDMRRDDTFTAAECVRSRPPGDQL